MPAKERLLQLFYWFAAGIAMLVFLYLVVLLFPFYRSFFAMVWRLLAPFLTAALIAYLLEPVIRRLHQWNIQKGLAVLIVYIVFFATTGALLYQVYPAILKQLKDLNDQLPYLLNKYQALVSKLYQSTSFLPEAVHDQLDLFFTGMETKAEQLLGKWAGGFTKILDVMLFMAVIPVLVFYFLKDYELMRKFAKACLPKKYHAKAAIVAAATDESLGGYIRGQMLVCLFVGIASYTVFHVLGIKYPLLLAIIMGITNLIPYFGPIIGAVPAALITLAASAKLVPYVLLGIFAIQLIEGNLLSPLIMGRTIKVHPVAILFALLLGGELGGIFGMIVAVPLLTIINTSYKEFRLLKLKN